jgi:hypothetical protein
MVFSSNKTCRLLWFLSKQYDRVIGSDGYMILTYDYKIEYNEQKLLPLIAHFLCIEEFIFSSIIYKKFEFFKNKSIKKNFLKKKNFTILFNKTLSQKQIEIITFFLNLIIHLIENFSREMT